jgi:hypothetical protein
MAECMTLDKKIARCNVLVKPIVAEVRQLEFNYLLLASSVTLLGSLVFISLFSLTI